MSYKNLWLGKGNDTRQFYKWSPYAFYLPYDYFVSQEDGPPPPYLIAIIKNKDKSDLDAIPALYAKDENKIEMIPEELEKRYPMQRGQTVNNCAAKNHFVGIKIRWQQKKEDKKDHSLYRWFRKEELKHIPFKSLSRALTSTTNQTEEGAALIKKARDCDYSRLHLHVIENNVAKVNLMLAQNPDMLMKRTDNGYTALHLASLYEYDEMIAYLLDFATLHHNYQKLIAATTEQGYTAFDIASQQKLGKIASLLQTNLHDQWNEVNTEWKGTNKIIHHLRNENKKLAAENIQLKNELAKLKKQDTSSVSEPLIATQMHSWVPAYTNKVTTTFFPKHNGKIKGLIERFEENKLEKN